MFLNFFFYVKTHHRKPFRESLSWYGRALCVRQQWSFNISSFKRTTGTPQDTFGNLRGLRSTVACSETSPPYCPTVAAAPAYTEKMWHCTVLSCLHYCSVKNLARVVKHPAAAALYCCYLAACVCVLKWFHKVPYSIFWKSSQKVDF